MIEERINKVCDVGQALPIEIYYDVENDVHGVVRFMLTTRPLRDFLEALDAKFARR